MVKSELSLLVPNTARSIGIGELFYFQKQSENSLLLPNEDIHKIQTPRTKKYVPELCLSAVPS